MRSLGLRFRTGLSCSVACSATILVVAGGGVDVTALLPSAGSALFTGESATLLFLGFTLLLAGKFLRGPAVAGRTNTPVEKERSVDVLVAASHVASGTIALAD